MTQSEEQIRAAVAQQAGEWFVANQAGTLEHEDRAAFFAWLKASPIHVEEYLGVALIARDLRVATDDPRFQLETVLEAARAKESGNVVAIDLPRSVRTPATKQSRVPRAWTLVATAAAAALVLAVSIRWWQPGKEPQAPGQTYVTAHGEQSRTPLADGSVLHLNTDSAVTVRYSSVERVVDVERGQALFEVAHDANRRFRVSAGDAHMIAVGTQFEVYRKPDTTVVTVVEGSVAVLVGTPPPATSQGVLPPGAPRVEAGYQVRIDPRLVAAQAPDALPIDATQATAWLQGKIAFEQRPLGEVADEFNRYARIPLEIDDPVLRALPISGVFDARDMDSFTAFLETLDGVTVQRTPTRILVFSLRR